ncbi:nucleotide exchange factor GrpE [Marinospirillum sp.]|uniref:nucleotide exchange factor GrpE n=1 Tax=Marinospirillum sp. TaxID=2183934 RepID=UPI003A849C73
MSHPEDSKPTAAEEQTNEAVVEPLDLSPEEQIAGLTAQIETLQQELAEAKDQMLRAAADAQNARRRAEADIEKAHKFALEKFAKELLPVADSLEKASDAMVSAEESQREGVAMTLKMFIGALEKFNIQQVHPQGETFNPQFHEAMSMVPNPELPAHAVMDVLQKGYTLNERLLRPAMVVVATGGPAKKDA